MEKYKYIIICPVRNEEKYIEKNIQSVINQTIKPMEWIIVKDKFIDGKKNIIEKYSQKFSSKGGGKTEDSYAHK